MFRTRSFFNLCIQKENNKRSISTTVKLGTPDLKAEIAKKIPNAIEKIREIRKNHGGKKIGEVTVNQLYMGMRGVRALVSETSELDPNEGIRFRGMSIPEAETLLPKAHKGQEPLPEGIFWLMTTGDTPTEEQAKWLSMQWAERSVLPAHVVNLLNGLPAEQVHPMAQLSAALTVCSTESKFLAAYERGVRKQEYWEFVYEDAMDLIAKIPVIASIIYKNSYKGGGKVGPVDEKMDWAGNFGTMMGYESPEFKDLLRLYLTIHCDHEGGNVSAHTCHLVGSALSDPYLSLAASMNGLAGPLHGLACQEVLVFLKKIQKEFGDTVTNEQLKEFVEKTLKSGQVIPGYGHAVLRKTDPRYNIQRAFALKHFPDDKMFLVVKQLFEVVPPVLKGLGKVANPWPNVDAHSGVCLQHYGMTEMSFYTVLFGVSRTLGVMASLIWDRALGLPIERPKSITTLSLEKVLKAS